MKFRIHLGLLAVVAACLGLFTIRAVTAQSQAREAEKLAADKAAADTAVAEAQKQAAADKAAAEKAKKDEEAKAKVAPLSEEERVVAAVKLFREKEKALEQAWDVYNKYKSPQKRELEVKIQEWTTKAKEFEAKGKPFREQHPVLQPPSDAEIEQRNKLQETMGGVSYQGGKKSGVHGPFVPGGSTVLLEALSKSHHMDLETAERMNLFAKVLSSMAEKDLAWHEMQKAIKAVK